MAKRKIVVFNDPKKGECYFNGISSVIDMKVDAVRIQHGVEKILGNAAKGILYNAYKNSSIKNYALLHEKILKDNENMSHKEFIIHCLEEFKRTGYGVAELESYDNENMIFDVTVFDCFNTIGYEKMKKPVCHIMAGRIAAIFEAAFGKDMDCEETDCKAVNDKKCVFRISTFGGKSFIAKPDPRDRQFVMTKRRGLKKVELDYDERGNMFFRGNSSIIGFRDYWSVYQQEFEKIIGPAAKTILYDVSKQGAIDGMDKIMKYIVKIMRLLSIKKITDKIIEEVPARGWGNITHYTLDEKKQTGKVRIKNCFNAVGYNGKAKKPICYSMAGNIAGVTQIIFGIDMTCKEIKCEGRGDKYCEFVIKPA